MALNLHRREGRMLPTKHLDLTRWASSRTYSVQGGRNMAIARQQPGSLILNGIIGGIVAGVVFAVAEMVMAASMGGSFFDPLRLIGSMALKTRANGKATLRMVPRDRRPK